MEWDGERLVGHVSRTLACENERELAMMLCVAGRCCAEI